VSATASALRCAVCAGETAPDARFAPAPIDRCADCGFGMLREGVAEASYDESYFENYAGGDYLRHEQQRRHESRVRLASVAPLIPPPARVLEVGAAAGFFLDEARRQGHSTAGVEPNEEMASHATATLGLDVRIGTLEEVALEEGAFDLACAFHVLEHIADPLDALGRMGAAVRPGGFVAVEVPNAGSAAAARRGVDWQPLDLPYHVGHHCPSSLARALERAGLEVLQVDSVPFAHYQRGPRPLVAARGLAEAMRGGDSPAVRPHPSDHQLLRGLARRPLIA
jgi:SAM-dependent methyltransferase